MSRAELWIWLCWEKAMNGLCTSEQWREVRGPDKQMLELSHVLQTPSLLQIQFPSTGKGTHSAPKALP